MLCDIILFFLYFLNVSLIHLFILARCDLNPPWAVNTLNPWSAFGATDTKITDELLSRSLSPTEDLQQNVDSEAEDSIRANTFPMKHPIVKGVIIRTGFEITSSRHFFLSFISSTKTSVSLSNTNFFFSFHQFFNTIT